MSKWYSYIQQQAQSIQESESSQLSESSESESEPAQKQNTITINKKYSKLNDVSIGYLFETVGRKYFIRISD